MGLEKIEGFSRLAESLYTDSLSQSLGLWIAEVPLAEDEDIFFFFVTETESGVDLSGLIVNNTLG